jgi:hypothetical protein
MDRQSQYCPPWLAKMQVMISLPPPKYEHQGRVKRFCGGFVSYTAINCIAFSYIKFSKVSLFSMSLYTTSPTCMQYLLDLTFFYNASFHITTSSWKWVSTERQWFSVWQLGQFTYCTTVLTHNWSRHHLAGQYAADNITIAS